MDLNNIKVDGHRGTWYAIDTIHVYGHKFYLLEHNTFGEDAMNIGINERGELILEDIVDGRSELSNYIRENLGVCLR